MNPENHTIIRKLDEALEILHRLDTRQQAIKAEIETQAQPTIGSFASSESPPERERTGH